ncbi:hypothetical protein FB45DRAFT_1063775, partial [Roridomyces roridus]
MSVSATTTAPSSSPSLVKGTSAPWTAGGEGPTKKKDKLNDNLLFSCCCARVSPRWSTVCDCYAGGDKCDQKCVERGTRILASDWSDNARDVLNLLLHFLPSGITPPGALRAVLSPVVPEETAMRKVRGYRERHGGCC